MSTFPTDVITDVLLWLPVKTLVRFKCVSKQWGSLINASYFAKFHLHHSLIKANTAVRLVLDNRIEDDDNAYLLDLDSLGNLMQLTRPFTATRNEHCSRFVGSCNGLVAVYHHKAGIALWNPSTRNCHYLPSAPPTVNNTSRNTEHPMLGFGYDVIGNDYKVVKMMECGIVMVYSLKANSWRRIKDCPYDIPHCLRRDGAYVNGSLHWAGDQKGEYFGGKLIFALDLGVEEFNEVPGCEINRRNFGYRNVGALGGSLCVFRKYSNHYDEDYFFLWVMKEYGSRESWTETFFLSPEEATTNIYQTKAIAYWKSSDRIVLDDGGTSGLCWYNLERKTVGRFRIPGAPPKFSAISYVESLVSVNSL